MEAMNPGCPIVKCLGLMMDNVTITAVILHGHVFSTSDCGVLLQASLTELWFDAVCSEHIVHKLMSGFLPSL